MHFVKIYKYINLFYAKITNKKHNRKDKLHLQCKAKEKENKNHYLKYTTFNSNIALNISLFCIWFTIQNHTFSKGTSHNGRQSPELSFHNFTLIYSSDRGSGGSEGLRILLQLNLRNLKKEKINLKKNSS